MAEFIRGEYPCGTAADDDDVILFVHGADAPFTSEFILFNYTLI
jgi:hypothetical protein